MHQNKTVDEQAIALAAGADDVVKNAVIVPTFDQAVADCEFVIGTSARLRHLQSTLLEPRACAEKAVAFAKQHKVAIVFGRERIGLTNEELLKCRYHLTIPANPDYSSLNLAMAVQLICYELRMAWLEENKKDVDLSLSSIENTYPTAQELEYFFAHTERLYQQLGFIQIKVLCKN
ncbi:RNA methyltransferase, TrmH family, group 1 [Avibacterium avium]|uniref:tRNA (cytidine/uridine-2'-O-)-methyltransferase TrmJ n=1 Tax=Avibacterium avium TaxID=751 RepID=A0A379BGL5_AVIAV|nr:RNA methyltransferase, TrmH family, group 1 [Avibacterium avium]